MAALLKTLLKALGGASLGAGGSYAGVEIYRGLTPKTWREVLERQGINLIDTENNTEALKRLQEKLKDDSSYSKVKDKTWSDECKKLDQVASYTDKDQEEILKKACSTKGKSTREALLFKEKDWIEFETSGSDEYYELMFSIYKFQEKEGEEETFLDWLNKHKEESDSDLTKDSTNSDGKERLKKLCKDFKKWKGSERNFYWWCRKLDYDKELTVINKIKKDEKNDSWKPWDDGEKIMEKWKHTPRATTKIKSTLNKGDSDDLAKEDYKTFCSETGDTAKKKLKENGVYQELYIVYKSVCTAPVVAN